MCHVTSRKQEIASGPAAKGEGGVAGKENLVGTPKFHSWSNCTMPLTNVQSDWMSNTFSGLCILTYSMFFPNPSVKFASWGVVLHGSFILHLGV